MIAHRMLFVVLFAQSACTVYGEVPVSPGSTRAGRREALITSSGQALMPDAAGDQQAPWGLEEPQPSKSATHFDEFELEPRSKDKLEVSSSKADEPRQDPPAKRDADWTSAVPGSDENDSPMTHHSVGSEPAKVESGSSQGEVKAHPTITDASAVDTHLAAAADTKAATSVFRQAVNGSTPTGDIQIGTPATSMTVIFDTGSDKLVAKTWLTVKRELAQVDASLEDNVEPSTEIYDHERSSSYKAQFKLSHGKNSSKRGFIQYGSGMAITSEISDTISVGGTNLVEFNVAEIAADSLSMLHTKKGIAGVMGLQHMKNRSLGESVFSRLRDRGAIYAFGYCRGKGDTGTFLWGDDATDGQPVEVLGEMHWAVNLSDVKVSREISGHASGGAGDDSSDIMRVLDAYPDDGDVLVDVEDFPKESHTHKKRLSGVAGVIEKIMHDVGRGSHEHPAHHGSTAPPKHNPSVALSMCPGGGCTAIIDTGSNIIAGPYEAVKRLTKLINVKRDCSNLHELPTMALSLGGVPVNIPPSAYVMKIKLPHWAVPRGGGGATHQMHDAEQEDEQPSMPDGDEEDDPMNKEEASDAEPADELSWRERLTSWLSSSETGPASLLGKSFKNPWLAALADLHQSDGVDLFTALGFDASDDEDSEALFSEELCMPAFVPLNKNTRFGELWVVGTPLFENYYTRFSYPANATAPTIFLQDKANATACQQPSQPNSLASDGRGLMRSAAKSTSSAPPDVREMSVTDIVFPHWAKNLMQL